MSALALLALLPSIALSQVASICGIEGPPDECGARGDPVNLLSGFTFHNALDLTIDTGKGKFEMQRYFMPIGASGGSKSPLYSVLGKAWPTGAPPSPFGTLSGEFRPTWSNDLFSFVTPCPTAGGGCMEAGSNIALVFEGDFKWSVFARNGTGFQTPNRRNPGTENRLEALVDGYRLVKPNGEQWLYKKLMGANANSAPVLLSEVRDPRGQLLYSLAYLGACANRVSSVAFPTSSKLNFAYNASCVLTTISYEPPGGGTATTIASYTYAGGVPGRLSLGGPIVDPQSYTYPASGLGWSFNVLAGGVTQATHDYALNGFSVTDYNGQGNGESFGVGFSFSSLDDPNPFPTPYLNCQVVTDDVHDDGSPNPGVPLWRQFERSADVTAPSGGSPNTTAGTHDLSANYISYNDDLFGGGTSRFGQRAETCTSGTSCPVSDSGGIASLVSTVVPLVWNANNICSDGRNGGSAAVAFGFQNKRGWWSAEKRVLSAHGEIMPVVSAQGMSSQPSNSASTMGYVAAGALEWATVNSPAQPVNSVRINERREVKSTLTNASLPNTIFDQRFIDTGLVGGLPTRFMELSWQQGNTRTIASTTAFSEFRGTFYRRARGCPASATDASNRVLRVEGPCVISASTAAACTGTAFPVTEFTYYDNTVTPVNNRGRLQKVSRYPNFSTTACGLELATTYGNFTAEGLPQQVTDPNGVVTNYTFSGTRMLTKSVVGGASTSFAYEADGSLRSIFYPEGNYEVFCRHANSTSSCDFAQPLLPRLQWRAKSATSNGSSPSEKTSFEYWSDGSLKSESYLDAAGVVRLKKNHFADPAGRTTYENLGTATTGSGAVYATRRFDGNDNVVAEGSSFTNALEFCATGTPSQVCSSLVWDRADRLVQRDLRPTTTATERTCLDYDAQGNPRRVIQGCSASDTCSTNHSLGASSTCTTSSSPATDYDVDDFGNVVAVRAPWTSAGGTAETRFEYNALGLATRKQTQVMRNGGTYEEMVYDQLGRLTVRRKNGTGGPAQLFALVYDTAIAGTGCPATAAAARALGRIGYRDDTFGRTGFSYDLEGRVTTEWGQRAGSLGTCSSDYSNIAYFPTTNYVYSTNGNLTSIRYPQGRTITYGYGTGGLKDRVSSISSTSWNGSAWTTTPDVLVSNITWEPTGAVRSYDFGVNSTDYNKFSVQFSLNGSPVAAVANACTEAASVASPDGTGRPSSLVVDTFANTTFKGSVLKKFFTWSGEELAIEQSCMPLQVGIASFGQTTEERKTFAYDMTHRLTKEARAGLPRMTNGLGGTAISAPSETTWGYTPRSNRSAQTIDGCPLSISAPSGSNRDLLNVTAPDGTAACQNRFSGPTLTWDADGRLSRHTDAYGFWYTDFGYGAAVNGSLDSVFHTVSINRWAGSFDSPNSTYTTSTYQYYYDALNRRRLKVLPTGATQEFFYGGQHMLLSEVAATSVYGGSYTIEDTVWLGGAPIALIRGSMFHNGSTFVRGAEGYTSSCAKLGDGGFCGRYHLVSDIQKKPILMVRKDTAEVTQAANYDAFGKVNRVSVIAGANHNYPYTSLAMASLPVGRNWGRVRANYVVAPYNPITLSGTTVFPASANPKVNAVSGYVYLSTATTTDLAIGGWTYYFHPPGASLPGLQTNEVEYFRTSNGLGLFTSLGLPGQYYDPETDLFENWNRYYNADLGRYLSPEPLLQSPSYVRWMAQTGMSVPTYAYAANNPLRYTDPSGKSPVFVVAGIAALVIFISDWMLGTQDADIAEETSRDLFPGSDTNGPQDAIRHCLWSCMMTQDTNRGFAAGAGWAWEGVGKMGGEPSDEASMDLNNNACGRDLGKKPEGCQQRCVDALNSGQLQTLTPVVPGIGTYGR